MSDNIPLTLILFDAVAVPWVLVAVQDISTPPIVGLRESMRTFPTTLPLRIPNGLQLQRSQDFCLVNSQTAHGLFRQISDA